jgi:hypothetical protein
LLVVFEVPERDERPRLESRMISTGRIFRDSDVKAYGNVAAPLCRSDWTNNVKKMSKRVRGVFVKRQGQWQLVSHSVTPLDPDK